MHSFEVHSNESACRKSDRLGLEQVLYVFTYKYILPLCSLEKTLSKGRRFRAVAFVSQALQIITQ